MKMKLLSGVLFFASLVVTTTAWSQCKELKWPENKTKAEECVAIYGDALKQGNYRAATSSLQWMLTNAPQWNTKLYVEGADIYDKLAEKETDPAKKKVLIDSLLWIYDQRIKNCGDEINVLNRKVYSSYKYQVKDKEKMAGLLANYDKVYEMSGNNVTDGNLVAYMTTVKSNWATLKNVTDEQIFQRYDKVMSIIDVKIKAATEKNKTADVDKLKGYKAVVDDLLISMVKVDCAFVKKNLEPKFKKNPTDINLAKKIFTFMLSGGCIEDPLWLEAGEAIHKESPDFGLGKNMARMYMKNKNLDRAEVLLTEALTLATTPADKSEATMMLGDLQNTKGSKSSAREWYRKALAANPENKEAYEKIGDLYYFSSSDCAKKVSLAEDRLVYIAAYDMYARSGNSQKMSQAKSQFPSTTEIFELSWTEGEKKQIGCWIGETVTLRTRGKD